MRIWCRIVSVHSKNMPLPCHPSTLLFTPRCWYEYTLSKLRHGRKISGPGFRVNTHDVGHWWWKMQTSYSYTQLVEYPIITSPSACTPNLTSPTSPAKLCFQFHTAILWAMIPQSCVYLGWATRTVSFEGFWGQYCVWEQQEKTKHGLGSSLTFFYPPRWGTDFWSRFASCGFRGGMQLWTIWLCEWYGKRGRYHIRPGLESKWK